MIRYHQERRHTGERPGGVEGFEEVYLWCVQEGHLVWILWDVLRVVRIPMGLARIEQQRREGRNHVRTISTEGQGRAQLVLSRTVTINVYGSTRPTAKTCRRQGPIQSGKIVLPQYICACTRSNTWRNEQAEAALQTHDQPHGRMAEGGEAGVNASGRRSNHGVPGGKLRGRDVRGRCGMSIVGGPWRDHTSPVGHSGGVDFRTTEQKQSRELSENIYWY